MNCIDLYLGKGVSNWILFPKDMAIGATVFVCCREMTTSSGRPHILDPGGGMLKGLVVGVDG